MLETLIYRDGPDRDGKTWNGHVIIVESESEPNSRRASCFSRCVRAVGSAQRAARSD